MTSPARRLAPPAGAASSSRCCSSITLLLMAFSLEPGRPRGPERRRLRVPADPGRRSTASPAAIASVGDRDHRDRPAAGRQRGAARRERAARAPRTPGSRRSGARTSMLTGLLQLRAGFDYQTAAAAVIGRESSEFRRIVDARQGHRRRDRASATSSIAAGGALAGRVTEVGPDSAKVVLLTDGELDGHRPARLDGGDRRGRRPARRRPGHEPDRRRRDGRASATRSSPPASSSAAAIRSPYPKGLLIGQVVDVKRDANDVVQTAFLAAGRGPRQARVRARHHSTTRAGCRRSRSSRSTAAARTGRCPEGEQPCFTPTPPRPKATPETLTRQRAVRPGRPTPCYASPR